MDNPSNINRRKFIQSSAAAASLTILPRHVLGGKGYVAPSDKLNVANIGCGTQGIREMNTLLTHPNIQVTSVCDVNEFSTDYVDWSKKGLLAGVQKTLGDKSFGKGIEGIPGGRRFGKDYVEAYYAKHTPSGKYKGVKAYEDFRELLSTEKDLDVVKIMTPDHSHAAIALAAIKKGVHVVTHKPIANRMEEGLHVIDRVRESGVISHLLAWDDKPEYRLIRQWINDGVIGSLKEIHNWSVRPVWPQYLEVPQDKPPIPQGFNWELWLGPEKDRPYHPHYTYNVFRGWYDFGGGSIADMGHYSLFPLFQELGIKTGPVWAKSYANTHRIVKNGVPVWNNNKAAFPLSCIIKFKFPEQESLPGFDLYWYDGGMKPFAPKELEEDGQDIAAEGLMFVGDKGKILAGFEGENPRILGKANRDAYTGTKSPEKKDPSSREDLWTKAIFTGEESPGSFLYARPITEMVNLGAVALRSKMALQYEAKAMRITNNARANEFLKRDYRQGWEI